MDDGPLIRIHGPVVLRLVGVRRPRKRGSFAARRRRRRPRLLLLGFAGPVARRLDARVEGDGLVN